MQIIFKLVVINLLLSCARSADVYYVSIDLPESIVLDIKLIPNIDYNIHMNLRIHI